MHFVLLLLIIALAQILGGIISWFFVKKFSNNLKIIIFSEMLLMFFTSLFLIIEGLKITLFVIASMLMGILALCIFNEIIPHEHQTKAKRLSVLIFIAMCLHEFPEGIAFGSSYLINHDLGIITAVLIALHNLPEGSIVSIPYFIKKKFVPGIKAVSVTQFLFIIGSIIAYYLLTNISQQFQASAMTFAAGAMLYIVYEEFLWLRKNK